MRIKSLLNEQLQENAKYDFVIDGVIGKFWESLVEMNGKPLSESAIQKNNKSLETMLIQTAMFLPDVQRERFFESLLNPKDSQLNEGIFGDVASGIAKVQDKIDAGKAYVAKKVVAGAKKALELGGEIFDKFVPESIKKMGKAIIEKVKVVVGKMVEKAGAFLKKIAEKLNLLGRQDPCAKMAESTDWTHIEKMLKEALYFTGDEKKVNVLADEANFDAVMKAGDISQQTAKAIALLKQSGVEVYGSDFRNILTDVASNVNDPAALKVAQDPNVKMSQWFYDNKMKTKIAAAVGGTPMIGAFCTIEPSFVDTHFGVDSQFGKAYTKLGLEKETALDGIIKELKNSKGSLFITIASLIFSFASGVGALRIVGLVFASVIPLIITARITDLENKGAPKEQIDFWKKARSISKFVNTVIQIFNIGSLIARGWEATTDTNTAQLDAADPEKLASEYGNLGVDADDTIQQSVVDASDIVSFDKLDSQALARMDKWGATLKGADYEHFKNDIIPKMNDAQFTELQNTLLANKSEGYARFVTTVKQYSGVNADSLGVGDVSLKGGDAAVAELTHDNAAVATKKAAAAAKAAKENGVGGTSATDIPAASSTTTYIVGQKVTLGDGTVGTVGELTTAENGAKFYKVVRNDGTIDWLPADAENAKGTVDKAMDVAMKGAVNTDKMTAVENLRSATMNDANRQLLVGLLNDPKLSAGTAAKLVTLTSDPSQLSALNSLSPEVSKEYLTTFSTFRSPLTPTQIVDLGISHPATAAKTIENMRASGVIGSSRYLLSTLQKIGVDVNQPLSPTDLSTAIDKIREIEKLKDVAGITPKLSA